MKKIKLKISKEDVRFKPRQKLKSSKVHKDKKKEARNCSHQFYNEMGICLWCGEL